MNTMDLKVVASSTLPNEKVQLHCGDSNKLLAKIENSSVDLILTDPPYNLGLFMKRRNTGAFRLRKNHFAASDWDNLEYEDWQYEMLKFLAHSFNILKDNGSLIVFMSIIKVESLISLAEKAGFYYKTTGVWHKKNPIPRNMNLTFVNSTETWVYFVKKGPSGTFNNEGKVMHDFFESGLTPASEKKMGSHPTQKPLNLIKHFVKLLSNKGDVIMDPFMGSGTTGVASLSLGRSFIGIELNESYFEIAKKRMDTVSYESN